MSYIEEISPEAAEGQLREVYNSIIAKRGQLSNVLSIQSLNPASIVAHMDLYVTIMFGKSPLRRAQREMIAVVVSRANDCPYCITHHGEALNHFWKDDARVEVLSRDYKGANLTATELLLCEYAWLLTKRPADMDAAFAEKMKTGGLTDRMILDASLIVSYFNFVNRMVLGLGVQLETQAGTGFNYD